MTPRLFSFLETIFVLGVLALAGVQQAHAQYTPPTFWTFNGSSLTATFPIVVTSCSGCGGSGGGNFFTDNTNVISPTTNTRVLWIGSSNFFTAGQTGIGYATSVNNYAEINVVNTSTGNNASADIVATNGKGNYVDLGQNGANNVDPAFGVLPPDSGYLYATGSAFALGTMTPLAPIILFAGGTTTGTGPIARGTEIARLSGTANQPTIMVGTSTWPAAFDPSVAVFATSTDVSNIATPITLYSGANASRVNAHYCNGTTGCTSTDGGYLYMAGNSDMVLISMESGADLSFGTGGAARVQLSDTARSLRPVTAGTVGLGSLTSPWRETITSGFVATTGTFVNASSTNFVASSTFVALGSVSTTGNVIMAGLGAPGASGNIVCYVPATGVISQQAANCTVSSERFKHDIIEWNDGLEIIRALAPVEYTRNADGVREIGFIAEKVCALSEFLCVREADGTPRTVDYQRVVVPLVDAVQSLFDKVTSHDGRIEQLERENADLNKRIQRLETLTNSYADQQ